MRIIVHLIRLARVLQFWGKHGPRALALAREARAHPSLAQDAWAATTEMDAFMYAGAAKGIVQQALTGTPLS